MRFLTRSIIGALAFALSLVALVLIGGRLVAGMRFERPSFGGRNFEPTWTVTALELARSNITPVIEGFGAITSQQAAGVRPRVSGIQLSKPANIVDGAFVEAGELLFTLDPFSFETSVRESQLALEEALNQLKRLELEQEIARNRAASSQSSATLAAENLARQSDLLAQGIVSESAVETAQDTLTNAQSAADGEAVNLEVLAVQVQAQELAIQRAELALNRAQQSLVETQVFAPISGVVSALNFVAGSPVSTGEVLAVITDPSQHQVRFQLSDTEYARLLDGNADSLVGRQFQVTWEVDVVQLEFDAVIDRLLPSVDASSGGVELVADLVNLPRDTLLREGAFVRFALAEEELADVFVLPADAVSQSATVFQILDDRLVEVQGKVVRRLGPEIVMELDLEPGTQIVARRYNRLTDGAKVEVFDPIAAAEAAAAQQSSEQADAASGNQVPSSGLISLKPASLVRAQAALDGSAMPDFIKSRVQEAIDANQFQAENWDRLSQALDLSVEDIDFGDAAGEAGSQDSDGSSAPEDGQAAQANASSEGRENGNGNGNGSGNGNGGRPGGGAGGNGGGDLVDLTPQQAAAIREALPSLGLPARVTDRIDPLLDNNQAPQRFLDRVKGQLDIPGLE